MKILVFSVLLSIGLMPSLFGQELAKEIIGVWSVEKIVHGDKTVDEKVGEEYKLMYEFKSGGKAVLIFIDSSINVRSEKEYAITDDGKLTFIASGTVPQSPALEIKENKMTMTYANGDSVTLVRNEIDKDK